MDFLRLIWPKLIGLIITLIVIYTLVRVLIKTTEDEEFKTIVRKAGKWTGYALIFIFFIWMIKVASINEVPRATIDRTNTEHSKKSFEERMERDAAQPRKSTQTDSTTVQTPN